MNFFTEKHKTEEAGNGEKLVISSGTSKGEERILKIKSLINEVRSLTRDGAAKVNLSRLCRKHGISSHIGKALYSCNIVKKVRHGHYKWIAAEMNLDYIVETVLRTAKTLQRSYYVNSNSKKKAVKKQYKAQSSGSDKTISEENIVNKVSLTSYFETDFELARCYIKLGENEKAESALETLREKVNKYVRKHS